MFLVLLVLFSVKTKTKNLLKMLAAALTEIHILLFCGQEYISEGKQFSHDFSLEITGEAEQFRIKNNAVVYINIIMLLRSH